MHILTKTLWIVIFIILISETTMFVKHTSYSKEDENEEKNILNITLIYDINTVKKVKFDLNELFLQETIVPLTFFFFMFTLILLLIMIVIWFWCPNLLRDNLYVPDMSHLFRRSQSHQPRVRQLTHYRAVYTRRNESIEGNENTEENC
nr:PREDICTED: uncharacterized protein LOC105675050 isoform X1 [Linepithema humile]